MRIGVIGGLALRAGVHYYELLLRRHEEAGRSLDLVLAHADVGRVLRHVASGDAAGLGGYLGTLANSLFDAGAGLVAISAVAPHFAIDEVRSAARGQVVDLLAAVSPGLQRAGLERVALFGNRAVMSSDAYGSIPSHKVERLDVDEMAQVHGAYAAIALEGKRSGSAPTETALLKEIAARAMKRGAQAVLLAGTDLSSFYSDPPAGYPCVDLAALHVERIVQSAWAGDS